MKYIEGIFIYGKPRRKFMVRTPYPTLEELRKILGLSKKAAAELDALVEKDRERKKKPATKPRKDK